MYNKVKAMFNLTESTTIQATQKLSKSAQKSPASHRKTILAASSPQLGRPKRLATKKIVSNTIHHILYLRIFFLKSYLINNGI